MNPFYGCTPAEEVMELSLCLCPDTGNEVTGVTARAVTP